MKRLFVLAALMFVIENGIFLFPKALSIALQKEQSRAVRGWKKAESLGCFSCHGPRGFGETPNPESEDGEVPSFKSGEPMMWAKNDKELKEYIFYGKPKIKQKKHEKSQEKKEEEKPSGDPLVFGNVDFETLPEEEKKEGLIKMPAFKRFVSQEDVEDIVVFIKANALLLNPKTKALKKGRDIVLNNGCFACHGPSGAGGIENPGSFKGYIPSFIGDDFDELVKDEKELAGWIQKGKIQRFERNPLARFFTHRQVIKMPAYEKILNEEKIRLVKAYLTWLRKEGKILR